LRKITPRNLAASGELKKGKESSKGLPGFGKIATDRTDFTFGARKTSIPPKKGKPDRGGGTLGEKASS